MKAELRNRLKIKVPEADVDTTRDESAVAASIDYLGSERAVSSIQANVYWPKWGSPWWHMTTLHEMGLTHRIPERAYRAVVEAHQSRVLPFFPIRESELPPGKDLYLDTSCHCALGNMYQTLAGCRVNVDQEIPWIRPWFLKWQLPDGGLNCDDDAHLHEPAPSSLVGTIAPLESVLLYTKREFTPEEIQFLDRGAQCLIDRKLMHATSNPHNSEEKEDQADWLKPCFPRFYFYDVLRGLAWILQWAELRKKPLPYAAISDVVEHLAREFPSGLIEIRRQSFEGVRSRVQDSSGQWTRGEATRFALMDAVSPIGLVSPYLTQSWADARARLFRLEQQGLLS